MAAANPRDDEDLSGKKKGSGRSKQNLTSKQIFAIEKFLTTKPNPTDYEKRLLANTLYVPYYLVNEYINRRTGASNAAAASGSFLVPTTPTRHISQLLASPQRHSSNSCSNVQRSPSELSPILAKILSSPTLMDREAYALPPRRSSSSSEASPEINQESLPERYYYPEQGKTSNTSGLSAAMGATSISDTFEQSRDSGNMTPHSSTHPEDCSEENPNYCNKLKVSVKHLSTHSCTQYSRDCSECRPTSTSHSPTSRPETSPSKRSRIGIGGSSSFNYGLPSTSGESIEPFRVPSPLTDSDDSSHVTSTEDIQITSIENALDIPNRPTHKEDDDEDEANVDGSRRQ